MLAVVGQAGAGGELEFLEVFFFVFGWKPADDVPGALLNAAFGAVFAFEAVLDDFELEGADGGEEGDLQS